MEAVLPGYYQTLLEIQEGFLIRPDQTRRLPSVLEHLITPEALGRLTEEISCLSPNVVEERNQLLDLCFEGIVGLEDFLLETFGRYFGDSSPLYGCSRNVKLAAASAITQAYPYEGLACFNPTIVPHPDQAGLPEGSLRVVLAVRSYGEYHRSAISFRTGVVNSQGTLSLKEPQKTANGFTLTQIPRVEGSKLIFPQEADVNNLVLHAPFITDLEETWEDIRFTRFEGEGEHEGTYLGTFTSFNMAKSRLRASLLLTRDFKTFDYHLLRGSGAEDKDLAFFPRMIGGRYCLISRNNGRDLFVMSSEDLLSWQKKKLIASCRPDSFDAHKMGVCAPPMETAEGWVVIYHGVADPGQIYSLGALLLDLEDPTRVRARLPYSIHCPLMEQELGMLTHVHYTCGALLHEPTGSLIVPYALNDSCWKVGRLGLEELLGRLLADGQG